MVSPVVNSSPSTLSMSSKAKQKAPISASPPAAGWISSRRPSLLGTSLHVAVRSADYEHQANSISASRQLLHSI
jgi:hypothetical protein